MASVLDKELFSYFMQLNDAEKKSVLQMLKTFLKGRIRSDDRITKEQYNKELDEAIARVEGGHFHTMEEVEKMAKQW